MSSTTGTSAAAARAAARADDVTAHTLLNCVIRELCGPGGHVSVAGAHLVLRLTRSGGVLRVGLRRRSLAGAHRLTGPAEELRPDGWATLDSDALAALVAAELHARTGVRNAEFAGQVRASRAAVRNALEAPRPAGESPGGWAAAYVASEQSLPYGHRFHPTPKARRAVADDGSAGPADDRASWQAYAPEAGARFRLRLLGVRPDLLAAEGTGFPQEDGVLPVHPWQFELLTRGARELPGGLRAALRAGLLTDLGPTGPLVAPTASVRTLYDPAADLFYKASLHVRITNCVRRSAAYELRGAVALTRLLRPVAADLAARFPGTVLLEEPAYRTVRDPDLGEALGVILRQGLGGRLDPGVTPLLAAAVADEYPSSGAHVSHLVARLAAASGERPREAALRWWERYVDLLLPPALHAYAVHGVLLEPHLQNVLVGVGPDGLPRQVLHRDLEGVKLLDPPADLPPALRAQVGYPAARAWDRLAYCVLVNNLGETASALADLHPDLERALWAAVRERLAAFAARHGGPPQLRVLLAGGPFPAKANLLTRWARAADRHATYVPAPNPLART